MTDARARPQGTQSRVPARSFQSLLAIALAIALTPLFVAPPAEGTHASVDDALDARVTYEWWDNTWHLRVPVLVKPELDDPFKPGWVADIASDKTWGTPAQVELDLTTLVKAAGAETGRQWPRDSLGRLSSFTLDPDSIRVVAYNRESGKVQRTEGVGGLMPHLFFPSLLENEGRQNSVFNGSSNAIGTVLWIVGQQQRPPGIPFTEARLYFIYFDIEQNGDKPPAKFSDLMMGPLRALWWIRSGTEFYGYAPAHTSSQNVAPFLEVYALYDNTTVGIYRYRYPGFPPDLVKLCKDTSNKQPCVGGAGQWKDRDGLAVVEPRDIGGKRENSVYLQILDSDPFFFKVVTSKPSYVAVRESYAGSSSPVMGVLYPSLDGAPVGTQFRFTALSHVAKYGDPPSGGVNGLHIVAFADDAQVTFRYDNGRNNQVSSESECQGTFQVARRSSRLCTDPQLGAPVTIESTAPIAVFSGGIEARFGTPAVDRTGSPIGNDLVTVASQSFMAIPYTAAEVRGYSYNDPAISFPSGRNQNVKAGADNAFTVTLRKHLLRSDVYAMDALSGKISGQGGTRGIFQPGGDLGTHFELALWIDSSFNIQDTPRAFITALYDDTKLEIYDYQSESVVYRRTINRDEFFVKKPGEANPLMMASTNINAYRITTSKPVFVTVHGPQQPNYGSYYQALPLKPRFDLGEVEFHGPLISWVDKVATSTFKPGDEALFKFKVQNLGSGVGGTNFKDSIQLRAKVTNSPEAWTPEPQLSVAVLPDLDTLEVQEITIVIPVPETAETGDAVEVELIAQSSSNPKIADIARAQVTIQTKYEFTMRFVDGGLKSKTRILEPGVPSNFQIEVTNTGTGDDEIKFNTRRDVTGAFKGELLDSEGRPLADSQGTAIRALAIPIGESRIITLRVTPPSDKNAAFPPFEAPVEGVSQTDAAIRDLVIATALTNVKTSLKLSVDDPVILVEPGEVARFPLKIQNEGVETEVEMSLTGALPAGWTATVDPQRLALKGPGSFDEATGTRQDLGFVNISISASDPAPVGMIVPIKVTATSIVETRDATLKGTSQVLTARVVNNFTLLTNDDLLFERPANPGEEILYTFDYKSMANGPMDLFMIATNLPPGWSFDYRDPFREVLPGDDGQLRARLKVRPNEAAGSYTSSFGMVLTDEDDRREIRELNVTVRVKRVLDYEIILTEPILVPPGGEARIPLTLRHVGNAPFTASVSLDATPGWQPSYLDPAEAAFALEPGQDHKLNLSLRAPADRELDAAVLTITGTIDGAEAPKVSELPVTLLLRDLEMTRVQIVPARTDLREGEPVVFVATVLNNGTVPVDNVQVALLVDGEDVRNLTLRSIRPNEVVNLTFSWNVIRGSKVIVMIDPANTIAEVNEDNNAIAVDFARIQSVNVPAPGAFLGLLVLAALGVALRRRRWVG